MTWKVWRRATVALLGASAALMGTRVGFAGGGVPAGGSPGGMPVLTVYSRHFQVQMPGAVTSGYVKLKFVNNGGIWSGAAISRLKNGATVSRLVDAYRTGNQGAISTMTESVGGIGLGTNPELISDLQPGDYVVGDVEETAKHKVLVAAQGFTVLPSFGAPRPAPVATVKVDLVNFEFRMPSAIPAGTVTFKLVNLGTQPHELVLFKLKPGKSLTDVQNFLKAQKGPPPGNPEGGLFDLDPGKTSYLTQQVPSGNYLALCFVTDPKTHLPHAALGMIMPFTVR